ncbi:hypothetical protein ABPG75_000287 [Micractinium tetrahymenae]
MERLKAWLHPDRAVMGAAPPAVAAPGGSAAAHLPDPVTNSMGLFLFLILVELIASWQRQRAGGKQQYNLRQTISNVSAGILSVLLGIFTKALHIFPYIWLHSRIGLLPSAADDDAGSPTQGSASSVGGVDWRWWLLNAAALLVADCGFYWQHRAMHASNLGWAAHVVHHSSPDFNLSTALRQGAGESTFSWLFYLPLALFCPPHAYALHRGLNTVYQFFTHTELVGRLWWPLELVLNTPSHHRVHHARNYGRRNFAGMLIVWDRAFGTFEPEQPDRPCIYGLASQRVVQGSYNPLWHQAHHAVATLRLAASGKVPAWRALLTRQYGPGMVQPSVTDAEPAEPPEPASLKPAMPAELSSGGTQPGIAQGHAAGAGEGVAAPRRQAGARAHGSHGGSTGGSTPYPWERRPLGARDAYAAALFFLWVLPGSFAFLLATAAGRLSPRWTVAGAGFAAWSVTTAAWLCGGEPLAAKHELARLAAQALLATGLPPSAWSALAARAIITLSVASAAFLVGQLMPAGWQRTVKGGQAAPGAVDGAAKKMD